MFNNTLFVNGNQNVQVPAHLNFGKFMLNNLRQHLNQKGDEAAIENAETGAKITYKELTQLAVNLAVGLTELGVQRGDVVALGTQKTIMFVPIELATIFAGATFTSFELQCGKSVLHHKLTIAQPKYFICSNLFWTTYCEVLKSVSSIQTFILTDSGVASAIPMTELMKTNFDVSLYEPVEVKGQTDTALILYSSGTTGMPKGVQLTHLNCILNSLSHDFKDMGITNALIYGELYHNYDIFMTNKMISLGVHVFYVDDIRHETILKAIQKHEVNIAFVVPSMVGFLAKIDNAEQYALDSLQLKVIYSRSCPLHVKTMDRVKQLIPSVQNILQGYGMTEAGEVTSENWAKKGPKSGSVGAPTPGITLKVVHPETREVLGPNQRGEICFKGPVLMKGYLGVDPSTYLDEQGFFKTGDLGYYDENEYFYIVDRLKEIIVVDTGIKVAPLELETILLLHPGVREAGVIGVPDAEDAEVPAAFVVKQAGSDVTELELIEYVANEVAPYMQLRGGVRFIAELPRNPRGKVLRRRLRETWNETH